MVYLRLGSDDFSQLPEERPEERHHGTLRHRQGARERALILGGQKGGGEVFQDWHRLVHAVPKGLQLVGSGNRNTLVLNYKSLMGLAWSRSRRNQLAECGYRELFLRCDIFLPLYLLLFYANR